MMPSQSKAITKLSGCLTLFACATLLTTPAVQAAEVNKKAEKETTISINQNVMVVSGRMSLGLVHGEAGEYVYVPEYNHKLSELNWRLDKVYMLGLGGSFAPLSWLKFNADAWFKVNEGSGSMDDYDWMLLDYTYTDWSHHDDVELSKGMMFDINTELTFHSYEKSRFFGVLGFKSDQWKWVARGGDYVYSSYYLYDTVGSFPDGALGITYEQTWYAPYFGIGFSSSLDSVPLTFSGRLIGSTFVFGDAKDQHHMRNLVFEEDYDGGEMFAIDLGGTYSFTKNFSMMLSYHYQKYQEIRSSETVTDLTTGKVTYYSGDVAGMDQSLGMLSLTAIVSF